ncbi:MAG: hypothetical protein F4X56_07105 [Gammaproteobacteria bacterium]|nr:hypothetical protein [Gammaproteobacteria bacterium]
MNATSELRIDLVQPNWNSTYMSAIAGAAAYFGLNYSAPTMYVESGYYAAINIQRDLKPCGPYCWNHRPVARNLESMGLRVTWLHSPFDCDSSDHRKHLLDQICALDDESILCMVGLEFQLLCRRDAKMLFFAMPWGPDVPTCVPELSFADLIEGKHFPGTAWFTVTPTGVSPRSTRLQNSFESAVTFYEQTEQSKDSEYYFGPRAWKQWAAKLESGCYDKHGHWWSSMVWGESRRRAGEYFAKEWGSVPNLGVELGQEFTTISDFVNKAASNEISDSERAGFIRRAQKIEARLSETLEKCKDYLNTYESN